MKKLLLSLLMISFLGVAFPGTPDETIFITQVDPLEKILKEQSYFPDKEFTAHVARGEHASFQFIFRNSLKTSSLAVTVKSLNAGSKQALPVKVLFEGYVKNGRNTPTPSRDRLVSASGYFPDPLLPVCPAIIPAFDNQPVFISIEIPEDAVAGEYSTEVVFSGKSGDKPFSISKTIKLKIYNVSLGDQKLWVTNWWFTDPDKLRKLNKGNDIKPYSDQYWDVIRLFARSMKEYRQNVAMISPLELCKITKSGVSYNFDFSNFDKTVEILMNEGDIKRIEGGHLGGRTSGWMGPFGLSVPEFTGDSSKLVLKSLDSPEVKPFYSQFARAFIEHLFIKKWNKIYVQHIADEPIESNIDSYKEISAFIRPMLTGIPIIEANHASGLSGSIDIWVPQLNFLKENYSFYLQEQKAGKEVWFYTCLAPQGNFANRFIELPLIQTRLLHWINYRFGATGYLHWGYNYWNDDPFGDVSGIIEVSCNVLPAGDSHIVYPGNMELYSSIRLEAMRDGICDYELLKMLEEKNPELASQIAGSVVAGIDLYDCNVQAFRDKRIKILTALSN